MSIKYEAVLLQCSTSAPSAEDGRCKIYLIGTEHGDLGSYGFVFSEIMKERPDVVFLEIGAEKYAILEAEDENLKTEISCLNVFYTWLQGRTNPLYLLGCWYSMKRYNLIRRCLARSEFQIGYETARRIHARVVIGDRPLKVTINRLWAGLTTLEKAFFIFIIILNILFWRPPKHADVCWLMGTWTFLDFFPRFYKAIWEERQRYMAHELSREAMQCSSVVAVVGRAHPSAILKYWPLENPGIVRLTEVPVKERASTVRIWAFVGALTVIFLSMFSRLDCVRISERIVEQRTVDEISKKIVIFGLAKE